MLVDANCIDPGFNQVNFIIDNVTYNNVLPAPYEQIPYTRVEGHFEPTRTIPPPGIKESPTTARHDVNFYFPPVEKWQNRFFHHVYPLDQGQSNNHINFALTSGGYFVDVTPGNATIGYRVEAAAAKIAKEYAADLYENNERIYGYIFGGSGGSLITLGALEKTTGVWDGAVPYVMAANQAIIHSTSAGGLFGLAFPASKLAALGDAVAPGGSGDIYAGLTSQERASLEELLKFGFPLRGLEAAFFSPGTAAFLADDIRTLDPTYVEDFWSEPGYAGASPPPYLAAAKVDHFATITAISRDPQNTPTSLVLDSVPSLGSIGDQGLETWVYAEDGVTRIPGLLAGSWDGNVFNIGANNDPALLDELAVGGQLRPNNLLLLAMMFYPRHSLPPYPDYAYDQYRDTDGTPLYPQREVLAYMPSATRTSGGATQTGAIHFKTIVVGNLLDTSAYPYFADWYSGQVLSELGRKRHKEMFRVYYNDSADHFDRVVSADDSYRLVTYAPMLYQALRDLAAWVEEGVAPPASTRYKAINSQISAPESASARRGIQPVVRLKVNGSDRVEVAAGDSVRFVGKIMAPPRTGKILSFDWYLGGNPVSYEEPTVLKKPKRNHVVRREFSFPEPGTYFVSLRAQSQRDGNPNDVAILENIDRVRVIVHPRDEFDPR